MNDRTRANGIIRTRLVWLDMDITDLEKFLRNHNEDAAKYMGRIEALYARFGKVVEKARAVKEKFHGDILPEL